MFATREINSSICYWLILKLSHEWNANGVFIRIEDVIYGCVHLHLGIISLCTKVWSKFSSLFIQLQPRRQRMEATSVELEINLVAKNTHVFRYFIDMHPGLVMFENQYEIKNTPTLRMVITNSCSAWHTIISWNIIRAFYTSSIYYISMFETYCTIFTTSSGIHQHSLEHIKLLNTTCNHVITITIWNVIFCMLLT